MHSVYTITHPATGQFYIGRTQKMGKRKNGHESLLRRGKHPNSNLQTAFNTDANLSWTWQDVTDKETAMTIERQLIQEHKDNPLLTNFHHAKTSQAVFDIYTDEVRAQLAVRQSNYRHTEESKQKISLAHKGRVPCADTLAKAAEVNSKQIVVNGTHYRTASEAAIDLGVHVSTVLNRARNPRANWDGWQIVEGDV